MPTENNSLVPNVNNSLPIQNMKVDKDKLGRPYAEIKNENGDRYKQIKLKNGKTKREMVSDR